jgi:hypothetical protein
MRLVQILLPLYKESSRKIPRSTFRRAASELAKVYGGVTAYTRSPAEGLWRRGSKIDHDAVIIYEVMLRSINKRQWAERRRRYEKAFGQKQIVVRSLAFQQL